MSRPNQPVLESSDESNVDRQVQNGQTGQTGQNGTPANGATNGHGKVKKTLTFKPSELKERMKPKKPPGGFDDTPLPDAPQGYTVRFIFQSASNLPPADLATASSDPFLHATLKGSLPKRHKEDPDLTHRTRTIRRTTEPNWEDEWVVANVPANGFVLKCRLYDEDYPDSDDRLGNVTIKVPSVSEEWEAFPPPGMDFKARKRVISKRAYFTKLLASIVSSGVHMTPIVRISMEVLGKSDPPFAQMYTVGPTTWVKHYSPLIGRITGVKVNAHEEDDFRGGDADEQEGSKKKDKKKKKKSQKYDFQANEMQLQGPVPPKLYHRYVEFRPIVSTVFAKTGIRGKILNKALRHQHNRVYNFNRSTEYGSFEPCSEDASRQFLRMVHFDEGGRTFTYVLTLDGMFRFTETGKEFGIDMLSKHTMHSNVETYIACSGEFFIRRLQHPVSSDDPKPDEKTHPDSEIPGGPPKSDPPDNPKYYQLIIDNDSGTYRPEKSVLPELKKFLKHNFPGLGIVTMHWEEEHLQKMKENQRHVKKQEGRMINMVMNRSQSSISSAESELDHREAGWEQGQKSKREVAYEALEDPSKIKDAVKTMLPARTAGESSK